MKELIIYIKNTDGTLERNVITGVTKSVYCEEYNIRPKTDEEKLVGWPETGVEWHGDRFGFGL